MSNVFRYSDILHSLIALEVAGNLLYTELAEQAKTLEIRKLMLLLADQEKHHKAMYEAMLGEDLVRAEGEGEEAAYIEALISTVTQNIQSVEAASDMRVALRAAKQLEMDTILLLNELKAVVRIGVERIHGLINEERKHLKLIYDLEKELGL